MLRSPLKIATALGPLLSIFLIIGCSALKPEHSLDEASPPPQTGSETAVSPSPDASPSDSEEATDRSEDSLPTFADYPVEVTLTGTPADVDLDSHPDAYTFRGQLWDGAAQGPNFAGHYTVVTWGCGTSCQAIAIVDAETGEVYMAPFSASVGVAYDLASDLLIVNPVENIDDAFPPGFRPDWLNTQYYQWTNGELVPIP